METVQNELLEVIHTRRSCRQYRQEPVPRELLQKIIEAGRMAPSGSNNQYTHFIVISNLKKLAALRDVLTQVMANTPVQEGMPPQMVALIERAKQGPVDVNYGAPVLVFTASKKEYLSAQSDCACALENMMLAATALGLGSCWINLYSLLRDVPALRSYMEQLGLKKEEEICGTLVLGYSDKLEKKPLPRKGNPVTYVE